jgi:uncharacterized protein (DUF3084 family)
MTLEDTNVITDTPARTRTTKDNNEYLPVNGSFLQLDKKGDKLVDMSGSMVRDPQSLITGLKQNKDAHSICAREEPWRLASKLISTPFERAGVATNDTSMRGPENSTRDLSIKVLQTMESSQKMRSISYLN